MNKQDVKIEETPKWIEKYIKLNGNPFKLYPYQERFIKDSSDKRIVLKARQTGFSTVVALESLLKCMTPNRTILIVSVSERQSQEIINKIKQFLVSAEKLSYSTILPNGNQHTIKLLDVISESKKEIGFSNGSRLISLPNNPVSARGYPANDVYLDEFAHMDQADEMMMAIRPTLSRGGKLTLISTPAGKIGKFFEIWDKAKELKYSRHEVHWTDCPDKVYKKEIGLLRNNMDSVSFAQEYEMAFLAEGMGWFPPRIVMPCVRKDLSITPTGGIIQFGMDVGKISSNTSLVIAEKIQEKPSDPINVKIRRVILWKLGTDYDIIKADLKGFMRIYSPNRVNIDSTGIGERYVEEIRKEEGACIMPVKFSNQMKERMFSELKTLFENGQIEIPSHRELLNQLFGFERTITEMKNVQYKGKHDDIVMGLALSTLSLARPRPFMGIR